MGFILPYPTLGNIYLWETERIYLQVDLCGFGG